MDSKLNSDLEIIKADLGALLQAQQISNYLAMSTNPMIEENIRREALDKALAMQGLKKSPAAAQFLDTPSLGNDLPSHVL